MSCPITICELRKAIDTNNFKELEEKMEYNKKYGAFSTFGCKGHLFKKKCELTKEEYKKINKRFFTGFNLFNFQKILRDLAMKDKDDYMSGIGKPLTKTEWILFLASMLALGVAVLLALVYAGGV